jgi:hypothetical protein
MINTVINKHFNSILSKAVSVLSASGSTRATNMPKIPNSSDELMNTWVAILCTAAVLV